MVRAVKFVPYDEYASTGSLDARGSAGSGKRFMAKVPSLLFDLDTEGDESGAGAGGADAPDAASVVEVVQGLQALLEPWSEPEYMLLLHVRIAREEAAKRGASALSVAELADTLRRLGYSVSMRMALGGGSGGACLRSLRHSFLTIGIGGTSGHMTYIVDPRFREQFEIAHTTPRYAKILEALSPEVVATEDRLSKIVETLCTEMARAFVETGTPLPPWRGQSAMTSKWQPRRSEDVDVSTASALNNGVGLLAGGATGAATVNERLAMLGVPQLAPPSKPSPISEGLERSSCSSHTGPVDGGASNSEGSSLNLDWGLEGGSSLCPTTAPSLGAAPTPALAAAPGPAPLPPLRQGFFGVLRQAVVPPLPTRRASWAG